MTIVTPVIMLIIIQIIAIKKMNLKIKNLFVMKTNIFLLGLIIPLFCMAQPSLIREYEYDEAGNRTLRKVVSMQLAPPAPPDTTQTANLTPQTADYFVETIAQVEIKIYPNPTTENVTLEISNMEKLQTGKFTLYSLTGQLLQEHQVYSSTSTVPLSNLPKGTYILKVNINNRIEDWKVIKN